MIPRDIFFQVGRLLLTQQWIFAKTMPQNPHWYTLRKRWSRDEEFTWVVQQIRQYGYTEYYYRRPYTMLNMNGMKYWTMGAPLDDTILINRKHLTPQNAPYDVIAPQYDAAFSDPASLAENRSLFDIIGDVSSLRVLDVGCGTGLFLDYCTPAFYTGIDPSQIMLNRLLEKHPDYASSIIACPLEAFVGWDYDLVVCLFGAANYIHPDALQSLPRLLRPGGRFFVMFLAPEYEPVTYQRTSHTVSHYNGVHAHLPGNHYSFSNYYIIEGQV